MNQVEHTSGMHAWWSEISPGQLAHQRLSDASIFHKLTVKASACADVATRTALCSATGLALLPFRLNRHTVSADLARLSFYADELRNRSIDEILPKPQAHQVLHAPSKKMLGYRPAFIPNCRLVFTSQFRPVHPDMHAQYRRHEQSHEAVAQHWTHPDGPRKTLVFTHGFTLDPYWINVEKFWLKWFYRQGFDVLLYTLPFHGDRRSPGSFFSGQGFVAHGFSHFNEAIFHSIHDLRVFIDYLRGQGAPQVGLVGFSLGGYVSSMIGNLDEDLAFCIPVASPVNLADMLMDWWPTSSLIRQLMSKAGLDISDFRKVTAAHCALSWRPRIEHSRLMIVGGDGDRFVSPQITQLLVDHWQAPHTLWHAGNHLVFHKRREHLHTMLQFMKRACESTR